MKVVVTGSAGVVGRAVRRALAPEHDLVLLDRWPQRTGVGIPVQADVTNWRLVREALEPLAPLDAVVHLAFARAYTELAPEEQALLQFDVTVKGTWIILNEALRLGARLGVFASSLSVFGRIGETAVDEDTDPFAFTGADDYGLAKTMAECVVRHFAVRRGMRAIVLRLSAVHEPGIMERRGTHVDDIGEGFRLALLADVDGFELVNLVPDNPGSRVSNDKAKRLLGWRPRHTFDKRPDLEDWSQPPQPPPDAVGAPLGAVGREGDYFASGAPP